MKSRLGFKATVEVKAVHQGNGKGERCLTSWTLRVSGPHVEPASIEVQSREDKPKDNEWAYEKSFDVIGWSTDGARLLTATVMAGGDWDETTPVIYDFENRKLWRVELAPVFSRVVPKNCPVNFQPVRFAPTPGVVIAVAPMDGDDRCFEKSLWSLDYERRTVRKIRNAK